MKFAMNEPEVAPARDRGRHRRRTSATSGGQDRQQPLSAHEIGVKLSRARRLAATSRNVLNLVAQGISAASPSSASHAAASGAWAATLSSAARSCRGDVAHAADVARGDRRATELTRRGSAARIGAYARREQDWAFQSNLAAGEITQIFKQLRAAQIREAIAELELKNHRQQMKHAEEIERFLNEEGTEKTGKKTNKALYAWMKREVKGLYAQCFQFAFDIAKKAERACSTSWAIRS